MIKHWPTFISMIALLGSALIAGTFFAFSTFVMRALNQRPSSQALQAMQSINRVVLNPVFLGVFVGTMISCLPLVVIGIARINENAMLWLLAGCCSYCVGTFGVTVAKNVPLNNALEHVSVTDPQVDSIWADYYDRWLFWNHVRTIMGILAVIGFAVAIAKMPNLYSA